MKTQDLLKELKAKNIRVPESWAVLQTGSGDFLGFMPTSETALRDKQNMYKSVELLAHSPIREKIRAEREAIKESRLSKL